uniref:THAP-type domain-containing protein n=1 Tax=Cynoglossus semilaevis TaxID=244447 RepID=A0A3P8X4B4_CYNSE
MTRYCVALGCSFVSKSNQKSEISLHSFPSDEPRRTEWQKACGRTQLPIDPRLCSQHFLNDAFEFCSRPRKLKPSAIPTIFYHESAKSLKQTRARACR